MIGMSATMPPFKEGPHQKLLFSIKKKIFFQDSASIVDIYFLTPILILK